MVKQVIEATRGFIIGRTAERKAPVGGADRVCGIARTGDVVAGVSGSGRPRVVIAN